MKKYTLINNMRKLRFNNLEMTQQELADKLDVSRQTIIAIEAGKYSPTLELAFRISQIFKVSLEEVFQYKSAGK